MVQRVVCPVAHQRSVLVSTSSAISISIYCAHAVGSTDGRTNASMTRSAAAASRARGSPASLKRIGRMEQRIFTAAARRDDADAMAKLLAPISDSDGLRKILEPGISVAAKAYEDEANLGRFVFSDGVTVLCFTVTGITLDQATAIATVCDEMGTSWSAKAFKSAVETALVGKLGRPH
jgi:hypothetical protein